MQLVLVAGAAGGTVPRLAALAVVLAAATGFGLLRRRRGGRVRQVEPAVTLGPGDLGAALGARWTLLQFSTESCASCASARRILSSLADGTQGVSHVELDASTHLDLARSLEVWRVPTVIILDAQGRVTARVAGVPSARDLAEQIQAGPTGGDVRWPC